MTLKHKRKAGSYGPAFKHCGKGYRHVENCVAAGLRFVGYADKINDRIRHKGWCVDEFGDDVMRGVVYQLPARNGRNGMTVSSRPAPTCACGERGPGSCRRDVR